MARKLRLEYEGARYHVIKRGNYRADISEDEGEKEAFEKCLFEAAEEAKWVVQGFIIMRNHYHLALETPKGKLVDGMKWPQSIMSPVRLKPARCGQVKTSHPERWC